MKTCTKCGQTKDLVEFYGRKIAKDGRVQPCKACCNVASTKWHYKHHKRALENHAEYRKKEGPAKRAEYKRAYRLKNYKRGDYDRLFAEQNGVCAICGLAELKQALSIDHDHKTHKIRGLLCSNCNNGLGRFKEDLDILASATSYLINNA